MFCLTDGWNCSLLVGKWLYCYINGRCTFSFAISIFFPLLHAVLVCAIDTIKFFWKWKKYQFQILNVLNWKEQTEIFLTDWEYQKNNNNVIYNKISRYIITNTIAKLNIIFCLLFILCFEALSLSCLFCNFFF